MKLIDILAEVLPEVAGCPNQTASIAVLRAAQELCRVSGIWNEWLDGIALVDGIAEYDVYPNEGGVIDMIKEVRVGNIELMAVDHASLSWRLPDWRNAKATVPVYYNVDGPRSTITVYPTPDNTQSGYSSVQSGTPQEQFRTMRMKASLIPSMTAKVIRDDVWNFYGEAITTGAKARLMLQRGQQWSEPKLGLLLQQAFDAAVASARIEEEAGHVQSSTIARPRAFR